MTKYALILASLAPVMFCVGLALAILGVTLTGWVLVAAGVGAWLGSLLVVGS